MVMFKRIGFFSACQLFNYFDGGRGVADFVALLWFSR